jgi:hypothetical protein|tara:strand:- start:235 stop:633 length:399 start_codon:yes stop_codon:yes gene_type:complete
MNYKELGGIIIILIVYYDLYKDQQHYLNVYLIGMVINYYINKFLNTNTLDMKDMEDMVYGKPSLLIQHISYSLSYIMNITENNLLLFIGLVLLFTLILTESNYENKSNITIISGIIFGSLIGFLSYELFKLS